jgi:hypothetical protein
MLCAFSAVSMSSRLTWTAGFGDQLDQK